MKHVVYCVEQGFVFLLLLAYDFSITLRGCSYAPLAPVSIMRNSASWEVTAPRQFDPKCFASIRRVSRIKTVKQRF